MFVFLIIASSILIAIGSGLFVLRKGWRLPWALLPVPVLVLLLWALGGTWVFSRTCVDVQICDGGGFLAFSVNMAVLLVISLLSSIIGLLAIWIAKR
jgi:hypothetical protein